MVLKGEIEIRSSEFIGGWTETHIGQSTYVYAVLDNLIIGVAAADQGRPELADKTTDSLVRLGFSIVFDRKITSNHINDVTVKTLNSESVFTNNEKLKIDRQPIRQIFVLGSPRSGTSALGKTLATEFGVPWLGEGHVAPLLAEAANALTGDINSSSGLVRLMAQRQFRKHAFDLARLIYFSAHRSASFVDKTPGWRMIESAPFLLESFPEAKFIYLQRNGISNVLSRMNKFGGNFGSHCSDWVSSVNHWTEVKQILPHFLEISQEEMFAAPQKVADDIAAYLGAPDKAEALASSLAMSTTEKTGAGLNRTKFSETKWTEQQISHFVRICGQTMEMLGYEMQ